MRYEAVQKKIEKYFTTYKNNGIITMTEADDLQEESQCQISYHLMEMLRRMTIPF